MAAIKPYPKPKIHLSTKSVDADKINVTVKLDDKQDKDKDVKYLIRWFCRPDDWTKIKASTSADNAIVTLTSTATSKDHSFTVSTKGIYFVTVLAYHPSETPIKGRLRNLAHRRIHVKFPKP